MKVCLQDAITALELLLQDYCRIKRSGGSSKDAIVVQYDEISVTGKTINLRDGSTTVQFINPLQDNGPSCPECGAPTLTDHRMFRSSRACGRVLDGRTWDEMPKETRA